MQLQPYKDLFPGLSSVTALAALPRNMRLFLLLLAVLTHSLEVASVGRWDCSRFNVYGTLATRFDAGAPDMLGTI
jgi:hypothetical protein